MVLNASERGIFPLLTSKDTGLKKLTPKQMLQRLTKPFTHVKAGNTSKNILHTVKKHCLFTVSSERKY